MALAWMAGAFSFHRRCIGPTGSIELSRQPGGAVFRPEAAVRGCGHLGADVSFGVRTQYAASAFAGPTSIWRHHSIRRLDIFLVDPSVSVPPAQHRSPNEPTCN